MQAVFAAKLPGYCIFLPRLIRALFQEAEWNSDLNIWGAGRYYHHNPTPDERAMYYALDSADDPENPIHKSGAAQFAEYFVQAQTPEDEQQLIDAFMINL